MNSHIGIVGHREREQMARRLFNDVGADVLSLDPGRWGCRANHLNVWWWHADHPADWAVTLEDDAMPVDGFPDQLEAALTVAPTGVVSLYLGGGYLDDTRTLCEIRRAERIGAHWLLGPLRHAVALAIRYDLLESMISYVQRTPNAAIDRAIGQWARRNHHDVAYTVPSLVDHRDEPSLVIKHRRAPRKAWRVGKNEQWCSSATIMV